MTRCEMEIGLSGKMVVSCFLASGVIKVTRFTLVECEKVDVTKYNEWDTEVSSIVSNGDKLLYTYVRLGFQDKQDKPKKKINVVFSRCCTLQFNPSDIPGSDLILAEDTDEDV